MSRRVLPVETLYVVVDNSEGTHHGTFDDVSIACDEARALMQDRQPPDSMSIYRYRRGRKARVVTAQP